MPSPLLFSAILTLAAAAPAMAQVSDAALRDLLTGGDPARAATPRWLVDCFEVFSGDAPGLDDAPAGLLATMRGECRGAIAARAQGQDGLEGVDLTSTEVAARALRIDAELRAEADTARLEETHTRIAAAQTAMLELTAACTTLAALEREADAAGVIVRVRAPRLCREGEAERLLARAEDALARLESGAPPPAFRLDGPPDRAIAAASTQARADIDEARLSLAGALRDRSDEDAALAARIDAARGRAAELIAALPARHADLSDRCAASTLRVKPWACTGRAQARHVAWAAEAQAALDGFTPDDHRSATGTLPGIERRLTEIEDDIAEALDALARG